MKTKLAEFIDNNWNILWAFCAGAMVQYHWPMVGWAAEGIGSFSILWAMYYLHRPAAAVEMDTRNAPKRRTRNAPKRKACREPFTETQSEAYSALRNLGYHAPLARAAVSCPGDDKRDLDELLRNALAAMRDLDAPVKNSDLVQPC